MPASGNLHLSTELFDQAGAEDFLPELERYLAELHLYRGDLPKARLACELSLTNAARLRLGALNWNQYATWPQLQEAGVRADRLGYDTLWTWDHLYPIVGSHEGPMFEAWLTLAAWAQRTDFGPTFHTGLGCLLGPSVFFFIVLALV